MIEPLKHLYYLLPLLLSAIMFFMGFILIKKRPIRSIKLSYITMFFSSISIVPLYISLILSNPSPLTLSLLYWFGLFLVSFIMYFSPFIFFKETRLGFYFGIPLQLAWISFGLTLFIPALIPYSPILSAIFMMAFTAEQFVLIYKRYQLKKESSAYITNFLKFLIFVNAGCYILFIWDIHRITQLVLNPSLPLPFFIYPLYHAAQCTFSIYHGTRYLFFRECVTDIDTKSFHFDHLDLTPREIEIAKLILNGFSNKEIGKELFIAADTVKKHLKSVYRKCDVKTRFELIKKLTQG